MKIAIINGPNLNLLGKREPELYGNTSFEEYFRKLVEKYDKHELSYFQSNEEGTLVSKIQELAEQPISGIILNAASYTHTSIALADTIAAISTPVIEVHISNIFKREPFRRHSFLSAHCKGLIAGFGLTGYNLAIAYLLEEFSPSRS